MTSKILCSMYNKTIIRFGFCDIQNNQGRGKGYQPKPKAEADNPYLTKTPTSQKPHPIIVYCLPIFPAELSLPYFPSRHESTHFFVMFCILIFFGLVLFFLKF